MSIKPWLDKHVVPLLRSTLAPNSQATQLRIHSEIHSPPEQFDLICVYLLAEIGTWAHHVYRLLKENGFKWDYMRDLNKIEAGGETRIIFGGDGSFFIHDNGMISCRLFTKIDDIGLILEIGCQHGNPLLAKKDSTDLYNLFKEQDGLDWQEVMVQYAPPFGEQ